MKIVVFYVNKRIAILGMLATVTGLQGGAHNGLGKGFGGLLGGITIETTKSTHRAFWLFGVVCAAVSFVYICLISILAFKDRKSGAGEKKTSSRVEGQASDADIQQGCNERNLEENKKFLEDDIDFAG